MKEQTNKLLFHSDITGKKEEFEICDIESDIANDKWQKWEKPMKVKEKKNNFMRHKMRRIKSVMVQMMEQEKDLTTLVWNVCSVRWW